MRVVIGVGEDFADALVKGDVPAPPLTGDLLIKAYEVANCPERKELDGWAMAHLYPLVEEHEHGGEVDCMVITASEPNLSGCEFFFLENGTEVAE